MKKYITIHGIITMRHGHVVMQIVINIPKTFMKLALNILKNLPNMKSTDSVSFTSLLIILPCGVVSKNDSLVLKTPEIAFLYMFLVALIVNANQDLTATKNVITNMATTPIIR